jgi:threonine/homoserine/homoserine lactone efflux protein
MIESIIKGFIVGMGASIPLGPLGVMCVQKTLSKGRVSGFVTGLGASISDTIFAALAIFSLSLVQNFVKSNEEEVMIFGGVIIILIGIKIFFTNPVKQIRQNKTGKKIVEDFISSVIMTITNPGAIFLIIGLFAFTGLEVDKDSSWQVILLALAGVFSGAISWWLILTNTINIFRKKFRLRQLLMINRISGGVISLLGLISLLDGLISLLKRFL